MDKTKSYSNWNIPGRNIPYLDMKKTIYTNEYKNLVKNLKKARLMSGLDQIQAAKRLGSSQSYISKIETGQLRIDVFQLRDFARVYKKPFSYFIRFKF